MRDELKELGFVGTNDGNMEIAGKLKVLFPTGNRPWTTVQALDYRTVKWFTDFPPDVPETSVLAFIQSLNIRASSGNHASPKMVLPAGVSED